MKLGVIDYDSGNLRSVSRALESQGVTPLVTGDAAEFEDADAMVLPGVGSGPAAMDALNQRKLVSMVCRDQSRRPGPPRHSYGYAQHRLGGCRGSCLGLSGSVDGG